MKDRDVVEKIKRNLPGIEQVVGMTDVKRRSLNEIQGVHPQHGSETGTNLLLHTDSDTWHCFRHSVTSDRLGWIAVEEGLVGCSEVGDISDVFVDVLEIAAERAGVELDISPVEKVGIEERKKEWSTLQKGYRRAVQYFKNNLTEEVIEWIKYKYGFDEQMIEKYEIGYAPADTHRLTPLLEKEIGKGAFKTGLLVKTSRGFIDFFQGRVIFPYKRGGDYIYFIARKTPFTPETDYEAGKYKKLLTHTKNHDYVSELVHNSIWGEDSIRGSKEVIITEGITDAISLREWGYPVLSPVTIRFKNKDIENVKRLVRGKKVYICNDADTGGEEGAMSMLEEIKNSYMIELPEGYDLNDYYKDYSSTDFEELKAGALPRDEALAKYMTNPVYLFIASLRENMIAPDRVRKTWDNNAQGYEFRGVWELLEGLEDVASCISVFRRTEKTDFRTPTAVEMGLRKNVIAGAVIRDMLAKGKFLYEKETNSVYYFRRDSHRVFGLDSGDMKGFMMRNYRINASTEEGKFVQEHIRTYGETEGEKVEVQKYYYYDGEKLYVHNKNSKVYVLDGEEIRTIPNGDEVYFETLHEHNIIYETEEEREFPDTVVGQMEEWEDEGSYLHKVLVNRTNFAPKTALTAEQQRLQFLVTMYMFPFSNWFSTRPILAFIGEKGSGKTLTMRMLGKFLMDTDYELAKRPDEEDFFVAAYNNPLYFIDQMDEGTKWLNDALAAIATGVALKQRKLYTDFAQAEAKIKSFIGVNARTPEFKRDDVVDRLLIFYVGRIDKNITPGVLFSPLNEYWSELWSIYMDDLNKIVKEMNDAEIEKMTSEHRIVEWAVFARLVARALDIDEDDIDIMLRNIKHEKLAFVLGDDPLLPAIQNFKESTLYEKRWYSANQLYEVLCESDENFSGGYKSYQSLAKRLPNVRAELEGIVGLRMRVNKHKHHNEYAFEEIEEKGESSLEEYGE